MVTWSDIWVYLRGNRSGKEANRLEREALNDPFLYEALEGLSGVSADHDHILSTLHRKIHRGRQLNGRRNRYRWLVAASVVLLGGVALLLLNRRPEQAAEQIAMNILTDTAENEIVMSADSSSLLRVKAVPEAIEEVMECVCEEPEASFVMSDYSGIVSEEKDTLVSEPATKTVVTAFSSSRRRSDSLAGVLPVNMELKQKSDKTVQVKGKKLSRVAQEESFTGWGGKPRIREKRTVRALQADWLDKFNRYVVDSLRYPEDARIGKLEGDVVLSVRLNRQGHPLRIRISQSLSPSCDQEAVRLVENYTGLLGNFERKVLLTIPFRLGKNPKD